MKYIFTALIFFSLVYSNEIREYHDLLKYEKGEICDEAVKDGKICKYKIISNIEYTDIQDYNEKNYIIKINKEIYSEKLSLCMWENNEERIINVPLRKITSDLYKNIKPLERLIYSFDFNDLGKTKHEKKIYYDIYIEFLNDSEHIKLYIIDEKFYLEKNYELY